MIKYIIKKIGYGFLVLIGVVVIVFMLFNVLPADPAKQMLGQSANQETIENTRRELGLDRPVMERFWRYVGDLSPVWMHDTDKATQEKYQYATIFNVGESSALGIKYPYLGNSYHYKVPVSQLLADKIPQTMMLAVTAISLAIVIGIFFGVIAAVNHNKLLDNILVTVSTFGISVPSYFSALVLAVVFGYYWADYTGLNISGSFIEPDELGGKDIFVWKNLILPAIALGIRPIAIITQLTRSSMLDVISQDYVRTARAKGLSNRVVLFKHTLRNALNPVVTSISGWFASLLAGSFFVELIFNYKGLGYISVNSLLNFDFPVLMGTVLFVAVVFSLINIMVDLLYGVLDPRIRLS